MSLAKRTAIVLAMVLLFPCYHIYALSGRLIDNNGQSLAEATVQLINLNEETIADASGRFNFGPTENKARNFRLRYNRPRLMNGNILFSLEKRSAVTVKLYGMNGALLQHLTDNKNAGDHIIVLDRMFPRVPYGVYLVSLQSQTQQSVFKYARIAGSSRPFSGATSEKGIASGVRKETQASNGSNAVDTLLVSKTIGDVTSTRKILIFDYADDINTYRPDGKQILIIDPSNDNDGDGLSNFEERYLYRTNAELFDTDGDGVGDYDEIKNHTDPLVAQYPTVTFVAKSYPVIVATFSQSIGQDKSVEISSGGEYSMSSSFSTEQQVNASASLEVMAGVEIGTESKVSGSINATVGAGWSMTFGSEHSQSLSRNWNNATTYAESQGVTIKGGQIKIDVELTNTSKVNVILVNPMLRLSSTDIGQKTLSTEIGELTLFSGDGTSTDNEVHIPFAQGQNSVVRQFGINISNPDLIEHIAKNSCGLKAQLTNIRFRTSLGEIDTLMANIYRRTAEVIVDFGQALTAPNNLIKKRVASRAVYNEFYTSQTDRYLPASLFDILNAAGVNPVIGSDSGKTGITEIDGVKNGALTNGM